MAGEMKAMTELKFCGCGKQPLTWRSRNDPPNEDGYWFECEGCTIATKKYPTREQARAAWQLAMSRTGPAIVKAGG